MKKIVLKLICAIMALSMIFSLCACGFLGEKPTAGKNVEQKADKDDDKPLKVDEVQIPEDEEDEQVVVVDDEAENDNDNVSSSSSEAEEAVAEYVRKNKAQIESASNEASSGVMTCKVVARGTAMVYQFAYTEVYCSTDAEKSQMKTALEESLNSMGDAVDSALELIKKEEPNVSSIVYEYYEAGGDLIISKEYKIN